MTDLGDRIVALIDMDCFFCQVEAKLDPSLKEKPMAVVQYSSFGPSSIIAVNYEARDFGVTRHMKGKEAKEKCPDIQLVTVPPLRNKPDTGRYRTAGREVIEVLKKHCSLIERASVDEAYLDITDLVDKKISEITMSQPKDLVKQLSNTFIVGYCDYDSNDEAKRREGMERWIAEVYGDLGDVQSRRLAVGGLIIEEIRAAIWSECEYRCSAGISYNKILAKLACGLHKPNRQTILPGSAVPALYSSLPVKKVRNLGGKFGNIVMESLSCNVMADLLKFSLGELQRRFDDKTGFWLYNIARGIDNEPVTPRLVCKSIGASKNFPGKQAIMTLDKLDYWINELAVEMVDRLERDMEENDRRATCLTVMCNYVQDRKVISQSRICALNAIKVDKIKSLGVDTVIRLIGSVGKKPITCMSICAGKFVTIKDSASFTNYFKAGPSTKAQGVDEINKNCENKANQLQNESVNQKATGKMNKSSNKSVDKSTAGRMNQSLNKFVDQKANEKINQSLNKSSDEKSTGKMNIFVDKKAADKMNQSLKKFVDKNATKKLNEAMNKFRNKSNEKINVSLNKSKDDKEEKINVLLNKSKDSKEEKMNFLLNKSKDSEEEKINILLNKSKDDKEEKINNLLDKYENNDRKINELNKSAEKILLNEFTNKKNDLREDLKDQTQTDLEKSEIDEDERQTNLKINETVEDEGQINLELDRFDGNERKTPKKNVNFDQQSSPINKSLDDSIVKNSFFLNFLKQSTSSKINQATSKDFERKQQEIDENVGDDSPIYQSPDIFEDVEDVAREEKPEIKKKEDKNEVSTTNRSALDQLKEIFPDLDNIDKSVMQLLPIELQREANNYLKTKEKEKMKKKEEVKAARELQISPPHHHTKYLGKTTFPKIQTKPKEEKKKNSIFNFVVKNSRGNDNYDKKVCPECSQMIELNKFAEHSDFHVAQNLQRAINQSLNDQGRSSSNSGFGSPSVKRKVNNVDNLKSAKKARSIQSFFT